jgi:hypothetical protein
VREAVLARERQHGTSHFGCLQRGDTLCDGQQEGETTTRL